VNWQEFYKEPTSMEKYIRDVSHHSMFLLEIMRSQPKNIISGDTAKVIPHPSNNLDYYR